MPRPPLFAAIKEAPALPVPGTDPTNETNKFPMPLALKSRSLLEFIFVTFSTCLPEIKRLSVFNIASEKDVNRIASMTCGASISIAKYSTEKSGSFKSSSGLRLGRVATYCEGN